MASEAKFSVSEVVKNFMREEKITYTSMASSMGLKKPSDVRDRLTRYDNIKLNTLLKILEQCGLELEITDKLTGRRWVIDRL